MKRYFLNSIIGIVLTIPWLYIVSLIDQDEKDKKNELLSESLIRIIILQFIFLFLTKIVTLIVEAFFEISFPEHITVVVIWNTFLLILIVCIFISVLVFIFSIFIHPLFPLIDSTRFFSIFLIFMSALVLKLLSNSSILNILISSIFLILTSYMTFILKDYETKIFIIEEDYKEKVQQITEKAETSKELYFKNYYDILDKKLQYQYNGDIASDDYKELERKTRAYDELERNIYKRRDEELHGLEKDMLLNNENLFQCYNKNFFFRASNFILRLLYSIIN